MINKIYSNRNYDTWQRNLKKDEAMLIGYLVAGDPDMSKSLEAVSECTFAGIDIFEIGVPSLNPSYEGDVIRRGHGRAIQSGIYRGNVLFEFWRKLRSTVDIPLWAMGYEEELVNTDLYIKMAEQGLIDGLVIPGCSTDILIEVESKVKALGVDVIRIVHGFMEDSELEETVEGATIIYAQLHRGTTGDPSAPSIDFEELYNKIRKVSQAIIVAGFGIQSPEKVRQVVDSKFDGAVIGTALVARWENEEKDSMCNLIAGMKLETRKNLSFRR